MKEKDIQREFLKVSLPFGAYELKLEKGNSMEYDKVADHQIEGLRKIKSLEGLTYKINDMPAFAGSMTRFSNPKPFDCFRLRNDGAYIGICFYTPRKQKEVICIDVDDFVNARDTDTRKSITKEKALSIHKFIVMIK